MNKIVRYGAGITIGICAEYLIRVEILIYPLVILVCMLIVMIADVANAQST